MTSYPSYRSLLVADIEKSRQRDDRAKKLMRDALYEVMRTAFRESQIDWDECEHEDRGDGILVLVPASVEKVLLVDHLIGRLQVALHQHNTSAAPPAQIRIRLAVHAGEVSRDGEGWSGVDLDFVFTLNGTPVLRRVLAHSTNSDLAVIASQAIYDAVLRHGFGPPDLVFVHAVEVESATAWIWVPGYRNPAGLTEPADATTDDPPPPDASGRAQADDRTKGEPDDDVDEPEDSAGAGAHSGHQSGGITTTFLKVGRDAIGGDSVRGDVRRRDRG